MSLGGVELSLILACLLGLAILGTGLIALVAVVLFRKLQGIEDRLAEIEPPESAADETH